VIRTVWCNDDGNGTSVRLHSMVDDAATSISGIRSGGQSFREERLQREVQSRQLEFLACGGQQFGGQQQGGRFHASGQAGYGEHSNVVILPEGYCRLAGLPGVWPGGDQRP
jgi:hypothetical protein